MKLLFLIISFFALATAAKADSSKKSEIIFGVVVRGSDAVLTKKVVQAASSAAVAYGITMEHQIEAISGHDLSRQFDTKAFTEAEKLAFAIGYRANTEPMYIVVKGAFGGGCIGIPTWSLPLALKGHKSVPVSVTNVRCSKSDEGFARLMKVAVVAMAI